MRIYFVLCSAYDRAAIKFRGVEADINFSIEDYEEDLKQVRESVRSPKKRERALNLSSTVFFFL